jgi:hypothetical protein
MRRAKNIVVTAGSPTCRVTDVVGGKGRSAAFVLERIAGGVVFRFGGLLQDLQTDKSYPNQIK